MKKGIIIFLITLSFFTVMIPHSESTDHTTITFTKFHPDGHVETFTSEIKVNEGESVSSVIAKKCEELLREDDSIQSFIQQQFDIFFIISAGSGLHFAFPPSFWEMSRLNLYFSIFPSILF